MLQSAASVNMEGNHMEIVNLLPRGFGAMKFKLAANLTLVVIVASVFLLSFAAVAYAANVPADFFGGKYADDESHSIRTIESTKAHRDEIWTDIREYINHYDRTTVMNFWETTRTDSWVDVRWWATDQSNFRTTSVIASVSCRVDGYAPKNECDSFDMKFNEDKHIGRADSKQDHTVCHEFAHTLGSDDGLTLDIGCFPQSKYSSAEFLSGAEKDVINARDY